MMNKRFYIAIICLLAPYLMLAQKDSTILLLQTDTKIVRVKWIPMGANSFVNHYDEGYNLMRYEVTKNADGSMSKSAMVQVNAKPIMPLRLHEVPQNDANTSKNVQFGLDFVDNYRSQPESMREAVHKPNGVNFMYIFNLYYLLSSNASAKTLGVYYEDATISPNKTYLYVLISPTKGKVLGAQLIDASKPSTVFRPYHLNHKQQGKEIYLKWVEDTYFGTISYNLYRADALKGKYVKVNKRPITTIGALGYSNFINHTDTVDSYGKTYYYKATSMNFFEQESQMSEALEVKSVRYLEQAPHITQGLNLNKSEIELKWIMDVADKNHVKSFSVFKSKTGEGIYKKINTKPIDGNTFSYKDTKIQHSSNYYRVCAYGHSGDSLCSLLKGVFLVDSVPPAKVEMTYGVCDTNYIVTIRWKRNTEVDFLGYRVFRTYGERQEPIRMTRGHIYDTVFVDTLPKKISDKKIYYAVSAIDMHFNPSALGKYIVVKIPDKIKPSAPNFTDYEVTTKGIKLQWQLGVDQDLYQVILYRKSKFDFGYMQQARYRGDSLKIKEYLDTLTKSNESYYYKLVAEDSSGLKSEMKDAMGIKQMDKFVPHRVENLQTLASRSNKMIKLSWDFKGNAKSFKIFRAKDGKILETYEFVSGSMREFYDKNLSPNTEYSYQVQATYFDNRSSYLSTVVKVKY